MSNRRGMRFRRNNPRGSGGSTFVPTNISGTALWLRADLGVTLNGSNVSAWQDRSGNGNNATQGTPANQPGYLTTGGANNKPYLTWVGGAGLHQLVGAITIATPSEIFAVARSTGSLPTGNRYLFDDGSSSGNHRIVIQQTGTNGMAQFDGVIVNNTAITVNSDFVVDAIFNGASSTVDVNNGAPTGPANPGTTTSISPYTIGNVGGGGFEWNGFIYEIIVYNRILTAGERTLLANYFLMRYGVA